MIELNKIYNEDCLETMARMESGSVDLILTDPPYGVRKADWDAEFPTHWIGEAKRISKRMLVMTGSSELIKCGLSFGDAYRDCIVLHARNGMTRSKIAFGNWIPTLVFGAWEWKARPNYIPFNVNASEEINHPSPKPIEAMKKLLHYYCEKEWTVYDPFMGSGTTAIACNLNGIKWIGSEIDETYLSEANKRIQKHSAQGALALSN